MLSNYIITKLKTPASAVGFHLRHISMLDDSKLLNHYAKLKLAHEDAIPIKVVIGQKEVDDDFAELRQLATKVAKGLANCLSSEESGRLR